jgi:hypothetical protein
LYASIAACGTDICLLLSGIKAFSFISFRAGPITYPVRITAIPITTMFGGTCCVPSDVLSNERIIVILKNGVIVTIMSGSIDSKTIKTTICSDGSKFGSAFSQFIFLG